MFTTEPPPWRIIAGAQNCTMRAFPTGPTKKLRSQSFAVASRALAVNENALLTRWSTRPHLCSVLSTISLQNSSLCMSPWQKRTSYPCDLRDCSRSLPLSLMSEKHTAAPLRHSSSIMARPIPAAPPVTMATLLLNLPSQTFLSIMVTSCSGLWFRLFIRYV
jgi:hypothetical protein